MGIKIRISKFDLGEELRRYQKRPLDKPVEKVSDLIFNSKQPEVRRRTRVEK